MEDEKSDLQRQLQNEKNARQLQEQFNEDQQKIQQALHKEQITTEAQKVGMVVGTVSRVLVETSEGLGKGGKELEPRSIKMCPKIFTKIKFETIQIVIC